MTALQILQILQTVNALLAVAQNAGVNLQKFKELRDRAESEGRPISDDELLALADDAQSAIDRLG